MTRSRLPPMPRLLSAARSPADSVGPRALGLLEFTQPQVVFERSVGGFRPQLFPYPSSAAMLDRFFGVYRWLFHRPDDRLARNGDHVGQAFPA